MGRMASGKTSIKVTISKELYQQLCVLGVELCRPENGNEIVAPENLACAMLESKVLEWWARRSVKAAEPVQAEADKGVAKGKGKG